MDSAMNNDHERATDEEVAARRRGRFGELPGRIAPAEFVETAQAEPAHEEPPEVPVRREWG
jgi:hypothetical protein